MSIIHILLIHHKIDNLLRRLLNSSHYYILYMSSISFHWFIISTQQSTSLFDCSRRKSHFHDFSLLSPCHLQLFYEYSLLFIISWNKTSLNKRSSSRARRLLQQPISALETRMLLSIHDMIQISLFILDWTMFQIQYQRKRNKNSLFCPCYTTHWVK